MILDAFAAAAFYVVPYLTGRIISRLWLQAWAIGCLFWLSVFLLAGQVGASATTFPKVIFGVGIAVMFVLALRLAADASRFEKPRVARSTVLSIALLIAASTAVYFGIWSRLTPYPLQMNWDAFEHITLADAIAQGQVAFRPSDISDTFTFDSYSTQFHVLLALCKILFRTPLLGVYWWLNYGHYLLSVIACYWLARVVFKSAWLAMASGIFGMLAFESLLAYESLFLIPQTLSSVIAAFAAAQAFSESRSRLVNFLPVLGVVVLMHYVIGLIAGLSVLAALLLRRPLFRNVLAGQGLQIASLCALVVSLSLHYIGAWQLTEREEAVHFILPLTTKLELLSQWYGPVALFFLALGTWHVYRAGTRGQRLASSILLLLLALAMAPLSYVLKFFTLAHYYVAILVACGIFVLVKHFTRISKSLSLAWLSLAGLVIFYRNQTYFKEPLYFLGSESNISRAEIQASTWLSQNALPGAFLVSDPSTQYVLQAASGVASQGGAYMSLATRQRLESVAQSQDYDFIAQRLLSIRDDVPLQRLPRTATFFILSGRYFAWQQLPQNERESFYFNIWQPLLLTAADRTYIDHLEHSSRFDLLFENDELAILQLRQ